MLLCPSNYLAQERLVQTTVYTEDLSSSLAERLCTEEICHFGLIVGGDGAFGEGALGIEVC